jgi:hypothetical protein
LRACLLLVIVMAIDLETLRGLSWGYSKAIQMVQLSQAIYLEPSMVVQLAWMSLAIYLETVLADYCLRD